MKRMISAVPKKLAGMLLALTMLVTMIAPAAFAANEAVTNDLDGVFTIEYSYKDPQNGAITKVANGSGFLINEDTLLTCDHVVHIKDSDVVTVPNDDGNDQDVALKDYMTSVFGADWERNMVIRVVYQNGSAYTAKEIAEMRNEANDFTAIKISEGSINNRHILKLSSAGVKRTDQVYAMGFPYIVTLVEDTKSKSATPIDVTVKEGKVSKENVSLNGVDYINHDVSLSGGMSGGPLVNENGEVVGINASKVEGGYNYAIDINQVISALDTTGTAYTPADGSSTASDTDNDAAADATADDTADEAAPAALDTSSLDSALLKAQSILEAADSYDADKIDALQKAVDAGNTAKSSAAEQSEVDKAADNINTAIESVGEAKSGLPLIPIIIGAVVVIIIIIIIIVVVSKKGKKNESEDDFPAMNGGFPENNAMNNSSAAMPSSTVPPTWNQPSSNGGSTVPPTGILNAGSGETSILNQGSADTTALNTKPYAVLTRKNSGQSIQIQVQTFIIGKERRKVTYCVDNNTMISRTHAQIIKNGSGAAIVDLNSKNGTFVNGIKCAPNETVVLKDGDTIQLADEEFTFRTI